MSRAALLLAVLLPLASPASALFDAKEMDFMDVSLRLEPEYYLHTLSFSDPVVWDEAWSASTAPAYRINGASLGCCDLLLRQELRFDKALPKGLTFRFRLLQDEDREHQSFHYRLELEKKLGRGFSAAVFGEPTFHKEDSDAGFGLAWEPRPGLRAAARHAFVDFNFNKRGHTTQRYRTTPATDEFSLSARPAPDWRVSASAMIDSPLVREIPDDSRTFSYRRTDAELSLVHAPPGRFSRRLSYGYEYERKGDRFSPAAAGTSLDTRWQRHRLQASVDGELGSRDRIELGGRLLVRPGRTDYLGSTTPGYIHRRWEAEPYLRWRRTLKPWLVSDLSSYAALGEDRQLRTQDGESLLRTVAEASLGAGLDFVFGPSGRIGVYGTIDLDELAPHPFDGGNIRAMFLF